MTSAPACKTAIGGEADVAALPAAGSRRTPICWIDPTGGAAEMEAQGPLAAIVAPA
jgi:hypothetical protein